MECEPITVLVYAESSRKLHKELQFTECSLDSFIISELPHRMLAYSCSYFGFDCFYILAVVFLLNVYIIDIGLHIFMWEFSLVI